MKALALDFEFNKVNHEKVNLVCCVTQDLTTKETHKFWLYNSESEKLKLKAYLMKYDCFMAYNAVAEARCFYSLGLDPTKFKWVDLFLEWRCLTNHNDNLNWGKQLVDGKIITAFKPKKPWELEEGETNGTGFKHTHSLAEATYKLQGVIRDTDHKNKMRDLIISDPLQFTEKEQQAIIEYCAEDVVHLESLWLSMKKEYVKLDVTLSDNKILTKDVVTRGKYAAYTAIMEAKGYPIDYEKTKNFSKQVPSILFDCQREINELFPGIKPFVWDKKANRYKWDQKKTREWIKTLPFKDRWELTETKELSLSLEAFTKFFDFKHDYPKDNLGAQFVRFLKLKQSLNGFIPVPNSKRRSFWDYVGPDQRVRPFLNIYGAQSGRTQPAATGFMMLKPAWMRALVQPKSGYAMASIDYGSQEFLIAALAAGDENMIEAYLSGDVYLAFAKLTGAVPKDATKDTHKKERDLAKSTVLGLSYLMSKYGLAIKLSADTGRDWTEDEAQEQIDAFYDAFTDLKKFQDEIIQTYLEDGYIRIPDGWYIWGDNENHRSVNNVPIQGLGAAIMRKAVELAMDKNIYVCMTLHDALYIEYPVGQEWQIKTLADCMVEAFAYYFPEDQKPVARKIKLDPFAWSPDYDKDSVINIDGWEVPCSNLYIDDRAKAEYEKFKQYFDLPMEDGL